MERILIGLRQAECATLKCRLPQSQKYCTNYDFGFQSADEMWRKAKAPMLSSSLNVTKVLLRIVCVDSGWLM
jgi:hypothetical protein